MVVAAVAVLAVLVGLVVSHHIRPTRFTVVYFLVLVPSVMLHEISHGIVADALGDDTARRAGRLTANPLAHVDLFGTILLPALLVWAGPVVFGYAKPVPVDRSKLRHPRNDSVLVSLAGPATNIVLFLVVALVFRGLVAAGLFLPAHARDLPLVYEVLATAGLANIWLALFNLLPLPPLDGSMLVERVIPDRLLGGYYRVRPYGLAVVVLAALVVVRLTPVENHLADLAGVIWRAVAG